jgi:hypothetical protein
MFLKQFRVNEFLKLSYNLLTSRTINVVYSNGQLKPTDIPSGQNVWFPNYCCQYSFNEYPCFQKEFRQTDKPYTSRIYFVLKVLIFKAVVDKTAIFCSVSATCSEVTQKLYHCILLNSQ